ncbi:MAG: hypothetical protein IJZ35_02575 [Clostridia bacterium]|nr:hypothetical protein [Clostridia bacterium]
MLDSLISLLDKDTSDLSGTESAFIVLGVIAGIAVLAFFVRTSFRLERISGKPSFSVVKVIMIAASPTIFSVLALLDIDVPFKLFGIITAVMCVVTIVWNIVTYGILGGIVFSIVHIVFGIIASMGIIVFAFIGIAGLVLFLFGGSGGGSTVYSSSAPEYVRDPATGKTVRVEKGFNGELYVGGTSTVLRQGDYAGEYIDSDGNRYIS